MNRRRVLPSIRQRMLPWSDVAQLLQQLDDLNVPRHPDVARSLETHDALQAKMSLDRPPRLLDLTPAKAAAAFEAHATHLASNEKRGHLYADYTELLAREVADVLRQTSTAIVEALRPSWDEAAAAINQAADAGIRPDSRPAWILNDPAQTEAWRAMEAANRTLNAIAAVRMDLTDICGVGPTEPIHTPYGQSVPYVCCFTTASGSSLGSLQKRFIEEASWLELAASSQLALNDGPTAARLAAGQPIAYFESEATAS